MVMDTIINLINQEKRKNLKSKRKVKFIVELKLNLTSIYILFYFSIFNRIFRIFGKVRKKDKEQIILIK